MREVAFAICLFAGSLRGETAAATSPAERELLDFHLIADGRGTVLSPRLTQKTWHTVNSPLWPLIRAEAERRGGVVTADRAFVGLNLVSHRGVETAVVGCALCHAGKAAGIFVPGLGNKTIDSYGGGLVVQREWKRDQRDLDLGKLSGARRQITEGSLDYAALISRKDISNRTQGLVPTAWILSWLYRSAGSELPADLRTPGEVKVPHLWGYGAKRGAGQFCDGFGYALEPGWLAAVPLTAGLPPQAVRANVDKLRSLDRLLAQLKPPAYPFKIDAEKTARGKQLFETNCRECHGSYRRHADGSPDFQPPEWIPIEMVQTDRERLRLTSGPFLKIVARNPLPELLRANPSRAGKGYFAPRLEGVWARFPYLHNASVPTLAAMLTPPSQRPQVFSLKNAGEAHRFDREAVGLTVPPSRSFAAALLRSGARTGNRRVYDTSFQGHSNQGHEFGTHLHTADKAALIEYLKTL